MITTAIALLIMVIGAYILYVEIFRHWNLTKIEIAVALSEAEIIRPDMRGLLPVTRQNIANNEQSALVLAANYLDTLKPVANVPHTMTFAPHYSSKGGEIHGDAQGIAQIAAESAFSAPDFHQLYEDGSLPNKGFLVGFDTTENKPVIADWRELYSALIGGKPGSGKSTLIRSLLAQAALQSSKFVVIDPHYGKGEESLGESLMPLRSLMLCDVAQTSKQIRDTLAYVDNIGRNRLSGKDKDKTPLVLVVDETTGLLQRGETADDLIFSLGFISQETRAVNIFAFCIGQNFSAKVMPTEVRNSFCSFISCRTRKDVARVMTGNNEFGAVAENLVKGQAVWMNPYGDTFKLAVPNCTQSHLEHVAAQLPVNPNEIPMTYPMTYPMTRPMTQPMIEQSSHGEKGEEVMGGVIGQPMSAEEQRIKELFRNGASVGNIVVTMYGIKKNAGQPYVNACNSVQAVIRKCLN